MSLSTIFRYSNMYIYNNHPIVKKNEEILEIRNWVCWLGHWYLEGLQWTL